MQRHQRAPFSPGAEFTCLRPFVMSGVSYSMGDTLDKAGIEHRRLRQMFEARMIEVAPADAPAPPVRQPEQPKPLGELIGDPMSTEPLTAEHRGFGRWYVMRGGETVSGPHTHAEAQRLVNA